MPTPSPAPADPALLTPSPAPADPALPTPSPAPADPAAALPPTAVPGVAQQPGSAQQPGEAPPGAPAPFSSPPPKLPRWAIVTAVVLSLLSTVGFGGYEAVVGLRQAKSRFDTLEARGRAEAPTPSGTADPSASVAPSPTGPRAATYPIRTGNDLARVCDGWYYPKSPKFTGKAPHQISVGVVDSIMAPSRHIMAAVTVPDVRESIWRAWIPDNPGKTQLVACLDLTRAGNKVKSCKYQAPQPQTVDLKQGFYRLRLYEAATGRKLLDKPVTGQDQKCPSVVFVAPGDSLYGEVEDSQLYELLKGFVMKKG
ncbi:hypothetical protein [Actinoplanes subtropicus]|uniref:hypothetical protein n=1 Tax=Actinoplanes subtropicus TaxID=543632 RepID=UPI0012FB59A2|nr:hypothetical protein [Actinoplanes subtropicus]